MPPRFCYMPVVSPLHNAEELRMLLDDYGAALRGLGGEVTPAAAEPLDLPLVFFVVTGGTERFVLDIVERRERAGCGCPAIVLAHRGHNSLPAALEILARLQQDGRRGRIVYVDDPNDRARMSQLGEAVHDLGVRLRLGRARIGAIGGPSDWLVASSPDASTVRETWGPQVIPLSLDTLAEGLDSIPAEETASIANDLLSKAQRGPDLASNSVLEAARVYAALKRIVGTEHLDAVTVRCFDLVLSRRTTGCFGLAQLNDDGIVAGCEGDLASTIGMLWAYTLLQLPAWMANPARLDEQQNTLWLAHCTVPRSMVGAYRLRPHFESGLGLAIEGQLATGLVTLLRVGGKRLDHIWASDAELIATGIADDLCRTQAQVRLVGASVADLLRRPLGNHLVLVAGHHATRLRDWWGTMGACPGPMEPVNDFNFLR